MSEPESARLPGSDSRTAAVLFEDFSVDFHLLENCSVSAHLARTGSFYELGYLQSITERLAADTLVVDVGAHIGNHTVYFALAGFEVLAIEPNPVAFEALTQNVRAAGVTDRVSCRRVAASDTDGERPIFFPQSGDPGMATLEASLNGDAGPSVEINTRRLDALLKEHNTSKSVFIKVDVEGHEVPALRGASSVLDSLAVIGLSVECVTIESFTDVAELLAPGYVAQFVINPTPTIIFGPQSSQVEPLWDPQDAAAASIRYGIAAAAAATHASLVSKSNAKRLEDTQRKTERSQREIARYRGLLESPLADAEAHGSRRSLAAAQSAHHIVNAPSHPTDSPVPSRVVVFAGQSPRISGALLSSELGTVVEVVTVDHADAEVSLARFNKGLLTRQRSCPIHEQDALAVAGVALQLIDWGRATTGSDTLVIAEDASRTQLTQLLLGGLGEPYIACFENSRYDSHILRLENGAVDCWLPNEEVHAEWISQHVVGARVLPSANTVGAVEAIRAAWSEHTSAPSTDSGPTHSDPHRILLVSYFALPATPVSVQRIGYWHRQLESIAPAGSPVEVVWLSATARAASIPRNVVVADPGEVFVDETTAQRLAVMTSLGVPTIGTSWGGAVAAEIGSWEKRFDTVIISCGPFGYLDLAGRFKDAWDCQVLLDFRDPYAGDMRMNYQLASREWMFRDERDAIRSADAVLSVNEECLAVIGPGSPVPKQIIANGYDPDMYGSSNDDRTTVTPSDQVRLIYSGTIFHNLSLDHILESLNPATQKLIHVGRDQTSEKLVGSHDAADSMGFITNAQNLADLLKSCDAGIVRVGGEATTATTKIFDYIAADLDIIIVTEGTLESGSIHRMTHDLERVFWVRNEPDDLAEFFKSYEPTATTRDARERFSRFSQARDLLDLVLHEDLPEQ
jgi:FkbM family methyltransferase